jgi:hypothetical protein
MLWQIRHFLNEISPLATSCAIPASVDFAISATAMISVFVITRPFPLVPVDIEFRDDRLL